MVSSAWGFGMAAAIAFGAVDFLGGFTSRRVAPATVVAGSELLALLALLPLATTQAFSGEALLVGGASGVVGACGLLLLFHALRDGAMGAVAPISAAHGAIPVLVALVAGQEPTAALVGGLVLTMGGVVVLTRGPSGPRRAALLAVVAAVCLGTCLTLLAHASGEGLAWTIVGARAAGLGLVGPIAWRGAHRRIAPSGPSRRAGVPSSVAGARSSVAGVPSSVVARRRALWRGGAAFRLGGLIAAMAVIEVAGDLAFGTAAGTSNIAVPAGLVTLAPVVTAVLARLALQERLDRTQHVGATVALAGALLLGVAG